MQYGHSYGDMCIYVYVYDYIYIYIERERERARERERQCRVARQMLSGHDWMGCSSQPGYFIPARVEGSVGQGSRVVVVWSPWTIPPQITPKYLHPLFHELHCPGLAPCRREGLSQLHCPGLAPCILEFPRYYPVMGGYIYTYSSFGSSQ